MLSTNQIRVSFFCARFTNLISIQFVLICITSYTVVLIARIRRFLHSQWHEPSKLHENPLEVRLHENSWPPRLPERAPQPLEEWRSLIVTDLELLLSERSEDTRNPPNCWSESSRSRDWSVRSHRTSRPTCDSKAQPLPLSKKPRKLTSSVFSKTPTCAPSTQRGSPSCQKTSNWHEESVENVLKSFQGNQKALFKAKHQNKH